MGHLTFAELIARRVPLAATEAAALTLAVARLMDVRRTSGQRVRLPDDEWLLLSSSGEVSIVEVHASVDSDETACLSALLRRLLRLDERLPAGHHDLIPGGLLVVLARNLGYIHLPATGPDAFRAALERFASPDPAVLSAVFWRAASGRGEGRLTRSAMTCRAAATRRPAERRQHGLSRADLRRELRDVERELFELRGRVNAARDTVDRSWLSEARVRRTAVAATLAVCFTGALAVAALAVTGARPQPGTATPLSHDVVLGPDAADARVTRAVQPAMDRVEAPVQRSRTAVRSPDRAPGVRRVSAPAHVPRPQPDRQTNRPRTNRPDPLAALRGGTRGIPFTAPPG